MVGAKNVKLLLAASLLIASPAFAAKQHAEPPVRFSHYSGKVIVKTVPKGAAFRACTNLGYAYDGQASAGFYPGMLGCAFGGVGTDMPCHIVVTQGKPHVKRHEIAHCAGWPADHPR